MALLNSVINGLEKWGPLINTGAQLLLGGSAANSARGAASRADTRYNDIENMRLGLALKNDSRADSLMGRYDNTFIPLQDRLIDLAGRKISPEVEAGKAGSDVEQQIGVQQDALKRNFGRMGVNPNDGAAIDAQTRLALAGGLGRAAAMTGARRDAKDTEMARLSSVAQLGASLPGTAAGFTGQAGSAISDVMNERSWMLRDANNVEQEAGQELGGVIGDVLGSVVDPNSALGKFLGVGVPGAGTAGKAVTAVKGALGLGSVAAGSNAAVAALAAGNAAPLAGLLGSGGAVAADAALAASLSSAGLPGATAAATAAGSGGGMMATLTAAAPWAAAAVAIGLIAANNMKKSSPLDDFNVNTLSWDKPQNFDNTKFQPAELNAFFGPAMKIFADTGNFAKAMAALPQPKNEREQTMLTGGAKALFGGTGAPMRQIAKAKGYGEGEWTAGSDAKKAVMAQYDTKALKSGGTLALLPPTGIPGARIPLGGA